MIVHALLAGAAALALGVFGGQEAAGTWGQFLWITLVVAVGLNLASMAFELITTHPTRDASRTVKLITRGRYKNWFWGGVVVLGNLIPLALMLIGGNLLLPLVGLVVLIGVFISQHIWVRAPQQIPLS